MKNLLRLLSASLLFALSAGSLAAAAYLKIEGVKGESRDKGHKGWIEIQSVHGLPASLDDGKAASGKLVITKEIDKATPALAKKAAAAAKSAKAPKAQARKEMDKPAPRAAAARGKPEAGPPAQARAAKEIDKASPKLAEAIRRPKGGAMTLSADGLRYRLEGARVTGVETSKGAETVTIHYESISLDSRAAQAAPAQNHNTTRSNRTAP